MKEDATMDINSKQIKNFILKKIKSLTIPAGGCTEIGAIGYCVAAAAKYVTGDIRNVEHIIVEVSPYIFRNVMRVGVPNFGQCGIGMIAAAGAAIKDPTNKLEIFKKVTDEQKKIAKDLIDNWKVAIKIPKKCDPVYVKTKILTKNKNIEAVVKGQHDNLIYVKEGKKIIYSNKTNKEINKVKSDNSYTSHDFTVEDLIEITKQFNDHELSFIDRAYQTNWEISNYGKQNVIPGSYTEVYIKMLGDKNRSLEDQMVIDLAAAIDARMGGAVLPVMSLCGSGDHGLTASIPQISYHLMKNSNKTMYLRSLLLVNLLVWKIKESIGSLSCMCGSVVAAATAAICGIAYQENFSTKQIANLMEDLLCTFNCCLCDGAKLSCTHKVCVSFKAGLLILDLAKNGYKIKRFDGVVQGDVNKTLNIFKKLSDECSYQVNLSEVNAMCKEETKV